MAAPDYGALAVALATAKRHARTDDGETLTELLELTAGEKPVEDADPVLWYRPWYAAHLYLVQNPERVRVLGGGSDRLEYADPKLAHAALLRMQAAEDSRLKLVVPPEYAAVPPAPETPARVGSVAVPTSVRW